MYGNFKRMCRYANSWLFGSALLWGLPAMAGSVYVPLDQYTIIPIQSPTYWLHQSDGPAPTSDANATLTTTPNGLGNWGWETADFGVQLPSKYTNSFSESNVFFRNLTHFGSTNWEMHLSTSGSIYSLRVPSLYTLPGTSTPREMVCCQTYPGSEWTDRVIQWAPGSYQAAGVGHVHVVSNSNTAWYPNNLGTANITNSAGKTIGASFVAVIPFWNAGTLGDQGKNYATAVPPYGPATYQLTNHNLWEWLLFQSHIRDMGNGVVEITYISHNFNPNNNGPVQQWNESWLTTSHAGNPNGFYSGVSQNAAVDGVVSSNVYGTSVWTQATGYNPQPQSSGGFPFLPNQVGGSGSWHAGDSAKFKDTTIIFSPSNFHVAGYTFQTDSTASNANTIGFVYAQDTSFFTDPGAWQSSWGWGSDAGLIGAGNCGTTAAPGGVALDGSHPCPMEGSFNVVEATNKTAAHGPNTVYMQRFYMYIGKLNNGLTTAVPYRSSVVSQLISYSNSQAAPIAVNQAGSYGLPTSWHAMAAPVSGAAPIFVAPNPSGSGYIVTAAPRIKTVLLGSSGNADADQGSSNLQTFLGWGIRTAVGSTTPPSGLPGTPVLLSSIMGASFPDATSSVSDPDFHYDMWVYR